MRKRISMLVLSLMLAVMMVACGGDKTEETVTESETSDTAGDET